MEKEEYRNELIHLEDVREFIRCQTAAVSTQLENEKRDMLSARKSMWEDSSHVVIDFDDIIELSNNEALVNDKKNNYLITQSKLNQLESLYESPYFGRMDFRVDGEYESEPIYIGRYSLIDKKTYEHYICDWRAPIASMYYDYNTGKAQFDSPNGVCRGEIERKRQYKISNGTMQYMFETEDAVRDEMLCQVLGENTDKNLRVIINTITKEQNEVIRSMNSKVLFVFGPAGSGKTSVGMHRLAYLLYHNRDKLSSKNIVVLSKNEIFNSYISNVLPELGEQEVMKNTFNDILEENISREYVCPDYNEQIEYFMSQSEDDVRISGIKLKYSRGFLEYIQIYFKNLKIESFRTDEVALYIDVLSEYIKDKDMNRQILNNTRSNILDRILYYEDFLVISCIQVILGRIKPFARIQHVLIDEAQDYNILQLFIMRQLYSASYFTILGDVNQVLHVDISTATREEFEYIFKENAQHFHLTQSYRSSGPINKLSFNLIGENSEGKYIDRCGELPQYIKTRNYAFSIADLIAGKRLQQAGESIGILVYTKKQARKYYQQIREIMDDQFKMQLIVSPEDELVEKCVILPVTLAKGLEFDSVIVIGDFEYEYGKWISANVLYLMCTRALHTLYILSRGQLPEILRNSEKYLNVITE